MVKILILFGNPEDHVQFDEYFDHTHRELLKALPGVDELVVNHVSGVAIGDPPYYLIVEIHFESERRMQISLNSGHGQAMARDYSNFATGGATILFCHSNSMSAAA